MAQAAPPDASAERAEPRRAVLVALTANVAVAIAKSIAFLASGSSAIRRVTVYLEARTDRPRPGTVSS